MPHLLVKYIGRSLKTIKKLITNHGDCKQLIGNRRMHRLSEAFCLEARNQGRHMSCASRYACARSPARARQASVLTVHQLHGGDARSDAKTGVLSFSFDEYGQSPSRPKVSEERGKERKAIFLASSAFLLVSLFCSFFLFLCIT